MVTSPNNAISGNGKNAISVTYTVMLLAQLLKVLPVAFLRALGDACVIQVNGFLAEQGVPAFQRGFFLAAQKQAGVAVADDRIHVVFIQGFELALCLQYQASRDFS